MRVFNIIFLFLSAVSLSAKGELLRSKPFLNQRVSNVFLICQNILYCRCVPSFFLLGRCLQQCLRYFFKAFPTEVTAKDILHYSSKSRKGTAPACARLPQLPDIRSALQSNRLPLRSQNGLPLDLLESRAGSSPDKEKERLPLSPSTCRKCPATGASARSFRLS